MSIFPRRPERFFVRPSRSTSCAPPLPSCPMRRSSRAKREQRVIVTLDQDFGEIYYLRERGRVGVLVLRLRDQTVASVNRVLAAFFHTQAHDIDLDTSLVVLDEHQVRVVRA